MPPKRAFVALQDRFVSSLAVACCPTMDLVAVLTLDHHLLVHRTTSWQKLMHIKPSDVGFEMVTLAWRPDGLQLAAGCDEGDVAIFEIESGELIPERRSSFRHEHCITAIHWAQINAVDASGANSGSKQKRSKSSRSGGEWSNREAASQSKLRFQRRSSRFLAGFNERAAAGDTVLVSADERGFIGLWWMGRVLLTRIDVSQHFTEEEFRIMEALGHQKGDADAFRIEQVDLAPDLSLLFLLVAFTAQRSGGDPSAMKLHRMLALDMTAIQHIHEDVALVASTVDRVHTLLNRIVSAGRQMATEWKNATRIFELKMGLIGSLYEKYACEDPPQVDMLSVLVTGITAPALAQYFAQDIQEMSVHRMRKALFGGCEALQTIADEKLKRDLVDLLFLLSELRGHAKWSVDAYAGSLGIKVDALDGLVTTTQDALVEMEAFTLAIHETRQDFALLFQWILERIRVHTSSNQPGGANAGGSASRESGAAAHGSKSLLNLRRLCDFLQRAADTAKHFWKQQPSHSIYKVETTFGNPVSRQLSARLTTPHTKRDTPSVGCIALFKRIEDRWLVVLDAMGVTLAQAIARNETGCFTVGSSSNIVEECHVRFRHPLNPEKSGRTKEVDDHEDEDEHDDAEAVDWDSLKHYGPVRDDYKNGSVVLLGFRLQSGALMLLQSLRDEDSSQLHRDPTPRLRWDAAVAGFSHAVSAEPVACRSFDFYGDAASGKDEQLAVVLDRMSDDLSHQEWLHLQPYDHIQFAHVTPLAKPAALESSFEGLLTKGPTHTFEVEHIRGRAVTSLAASVRPSSSTASVIATGSRGVLCVVLSPSRLAVFDAEDSDDDADEDEEADADE